MDAPDERTMHPATLMSVEEYLRTSFEEADQDFVDGALEARHVGELPHSFVQGQVRDLLLVDKRLGLQVADPPITLRLPDVLTVLDSLDG